MKRVHYVAVTVIAVLAGTGAVALATGAPRETQPPAPRPVMTPNPACVRPDPPPPTTSTAPPSQQLLDTLGVLKRPATAQDRPPEHTLDVAFMLAGVKLDAARQIADDTWLVPAEDVQRVSPAAERCLRTYPPKQRREIRELEAQPRQRGPVEGVALTGPVPGSFAGAYPGNRREPPTPLDHPSDAKIELTTSRWEAEDSGPLLAGATYTHGAKHCLLIAPETTLKAGGQAHRFCVDNSALKQRAYIAHATRLANGDVILEGFADRAQISYMTLEHAIVPGARRLPTAKDSGAFFFAVKGPRRRGGAFDLHAARRGAPVRYFNRRIIHLARAE